MKTHLVKQQRVLKSLRRCLLVALPIMAGYIVLGIPCGILGVQAGMSPLQIALMSLLFYSGAGQYLIPNLWLASTPVVSIVASVSLINTRQILYGASLSRFCERVGRRWLAFLFAATVTDESFGVNLERFTHDKDWNIARATTVNLFALLAWTCANVAGALVGSLLSVPVVLASFAMTSIFLCLLFMQRLMLEAVVAATVAAIGVFACKLLGFAGPAILIGALCGIVAALLVGATRSPRVEQGAGSEAKERKNGENEESEGTGCKCEEARHGYAEDKGVECGDKRQENGALP
jgi:4-azaleucine resistance transporter AzlC